jgi:hypothetical protein
MLGHASLKLRNWRTAPTKNGDEENKLMSSTSTYYNKFALITFYLYSAAFSTPIMLRPAWQKLTDQPLPLQYLLIKAKQQCYKRTQVLHFDCLRESAILGLSVIRLVARRVLQE